MKTQIWVYIVVIVLAAGAGVAIAGLPNNEPRDPTIVPPTTTEPAPVTFPTTTVAPETTAAETTDDATTDDGATADEPADTTDADEPADESADATGDTDGETTDDQPADTDAAESTSTTVVGLPERVELDVVVVNGADIGGVARANADRLQDDFGYVEVRSLDGSELRDITVIFAAEGLQEVAERLAEDVGIDPALVFPIVDLPEVSGYDDEPLVVYLGRDIETL